MDAPNPYPIQQTPLTLPCGVEITILNLLVSRMLDLPGGTFVIQYRTPTEAADMAARLSEARELVALHQAFADKEGLDEIRADICETVAAAQMREPAQTRLSFCRDDAGVWTIRDTSP